MDAVGWKVHFWFQKRPVRPWLATATMGVSGTEGLAPACAI